jgi:hypothetical protein
LHGRFFASCFILCFQNDESLAQTLASNQQINSPYIGGDENTRHKSITALNSPFISGSENTRHKSITALNSPFISGLEDKRHKLIQQLRHAIMMFDYQRDLYREKANTVSCFMSSNDLSSSSASRR